MFCTCPCGEVVAAFSDQLQREVGAEAVDLRDVFSEQGEECRADIEGQSIRLIGSRPAWGQQRIGSATATDAELLQYGFDPSVAGRHLLLVSVLEGECLLQPKQVLGAVAAGERLFDRLSTGTAPVIAQVR